MAALLVDGTEIPIAHDGVSPSIDEIGDRSRMFDGSMLESVRAEKRVFACRTTLQTRAAADAYQAALLANPPVACSGDLFNNVPTDCFAKINAMIPEPTVSGLRWRLAFTLYEA